MEREDKPRSGHFRRIIPCLDIKEGRVVKGVNFVNLKDAGDPAECAAVYSKEGADEIVLLDITASLQKRKTILEVLKKTAERVFIPLTIGGGISGIEDIGLLLKSGADKVSLNTQAIENPLLIKEAAYEFGRQCIVVAIDVKDTEVYIYGGTKPTGIKARDWAKRVEDEGAGEILLTSMDKDGTESGYDLELTRGICEAVNIPVIASGGAGNLEHLYQALAFAKADAVLAASIFHYGKYSIKEAKEYLKGQGIPIRL